MTGRGTVSSSRCLMDSAASSWPVPRSRSNSSAFLTASFAAGDLDPWISAFAEAMVLGASAAQQIVVRIDQLRDDYRRRVRTRRGSTVPAVIDALLGSPAVTTRSIEDRFGVTEARAQQILHQLADVEVLQRSDMRAGGRSVWIAPGVIDAMDASPRPRPVSQAR